MSIMQPSPARNTKQMPKTQLNGATSSRPSAHTHTYQTPASSLSLLCMSHTHPHLGPSSLSNFTTFSFTTTQGSDVHFHKQAAGPFQGTVPDLLQDFGTEPLNIFKTVLLFLLDSLLKTKPKTEPFVKFWNVCPYLHLPCKPVIFVHDYAQ